MFITISRQFAAGGSIVANLVSQALDWTVVDNAFIDEIASRTGYARDDVESLEERVPNFLERLAQSSALSFPDVLMSTPEVIAEPEQLKLARITRELVADLGRRDRMVFVGRAAAAVLARESDALHVRLVASKPFRILQAAARLDVPEDEATDILEDRDRNRAEYHRQYYERDWRDPANYHMVLNTELLGLVGAAEVIVARARKLGW